VIWTTALTNVCRSTASLVVVVVVVVAQLLQLLLQRVGVCIIQGGVIVINIGWYCDLDHSIDQCLPQYSFSRLDEPDAKIAKGSNFRFPSLSVSVCLFDCLSVCVSVCLCLSIYLSVCLSLSLSVYMHV